MGEAQNMPDMEEGSLLVGMGGYSFLSVLVNFELDLLCADDLKLNLNFLD